MTIDELMTGKKPGEIKISGGDGMTFDDLINMERFKEIMEEARNRSGFCEPFQRFVSPKKYAHLLSILEKNKEDRTEAEKIELRAYNVHD